jgi:hypothetical protein
LGVEFLKIASFMAFQSLHKVRMMIDLAPFWTIVCAFVVALANQLFNSSLQSGMQARRLSLLQTSNQTCCEKEH